MRYGNRIELFTNIDPMRTYENLFGAEGVGYLEQNRKGLISLSLKGQADVIVQITTKGFIRIYFRPGSNLVEAWRRLRELAVPRWKKALGAIIDGMYLKTEMSDWYGLLKEFIRLGFSLGPDHHSLHMAHKISRYAEKVWLTAASLIALEIAISRDPGDRTEDIADEIYRLIIRLWRKGGLPWSPLRAILPYLIEDKGK